MNSRMEWLDDGETVEFNSYLLEQLTEIVTAACRKNGIGALYASDVAKILRDLPELDAIQMFEGLHEAKRDLRALILAKAERGLALSDRAEERLAALKSRETFQEAEVTRLAESE